MKTLPGGAGKTAGVAGMGRSGAAAARLLASRGYTVTGFDSSPGAEAPVNVHRLVKGYPQPSDMAGLSILVTSPGVPPSSRIHELAMRRKIPIVPEVELGWACVRGDTIAVTGSNGKTTTVEWLGHVLKNAPGLSGSVVAGNMGYALCDAVLDNPECPVFSLELSSYQLEAITDFRAVSAAFLNLTPDHLDRHGSMENYSEAKARIFMNQTEQDTAVLNMDDPVTGDMSSKVKGRLLQFSLVREVDAGAWLDPGGMIRFRNSGNTVNVINRSELGIPGRHNTANALAVVCLAFSYGIPVEYLRKALKSFSGVSHRIEPLGRIRGINWVNDSKSTNADSLRVALESFPEKVILLAGGRGKNSDYTVLRNLIENHVKFMVLFGEAALSLEEQWKDSADIHLAENLQEAVKTALKHAVSGDTVLLSPGCASFDQYRDFEERGEHFREIVGGLE